MKSKPTKKLPKKPKTGDAARQAPVSPVPASPSSPADRKDDFAEVIRESRWLLEHGDEYRAKLLQNIKERLPQLEDLLAKTEDHWGMEDSVYRFYHQSFKVYGLQARTERICKVMQELLPDRPMNKWFSGIVAQGTGRQFEMSHNEDWLRHTRPILEALFHAHYFLRMICKYGKQLETSPNMLPSGWAAVLYLFNLR